MPSAVALLSEEEKDRILHHLGYVLTDPVASIQLGVPRASQPMFLVLSQFNRIPDHAVGLIRKYLAILDRIEDLLVDAMDRFAAKELGEITLRDNETDMLENEYARWARRLADDLGVPLNPFAARLWGGKASLSIPVNQ
jgi:hypothetical protein